MRQDNAKLKETKELKKTLMDREAKVLATEFYKRLQGEGLESRDVISVTTQLLGIATEAMAGDDNRNHH